MNTLLLDQDDWDLLLDSSGNIALAAIPYATAQDVASAVRTFLSECWYDTTKGIPYFENILGHLPSVSILKEYIVRQALAVPNVASATVVIQSLEGRKITGQIHLINNNGVSQIANF